ncbi:hypothetical protein GLOTRDRAFT_48581 [Gloeophyllum trabeum ATCC 11539]|uniref:Haloacid dehalogenase n=1 Tax=Gloeophyllum trabeum (strain ATCC 11539 / FP-39264 / Madison 617) TaxID=670483 RepID=S7PVN6_GLOTA|nr:uncharacterized protein GLOTRDRAFT_48581 [Gloeophyllum trabeum ATCC 11539]EPQ51691.1 hypothetical protein GLOTRDRAFT_48581 [Gloeophyllum trabeum ATCC 11539]
MPAEKKVLAFDIYGTLLDTGAIAQAIQKYVKEIEAADQAKALAASWRTYQLEYTWRLNSMDLYEPFDVVTRKSLLNAAADANIQLTAPTLGLLMQAYHELPSFADAASSIRSLLSRGDVDVVLFSNGASATSMLSAHTGADAIMVAKSITAAALPITLSRYLANSAKKYKPCREIYHGLVQFLGVQDRVQDVWLVSGNPFDVAGARAFGLNAIWVDRAGKGWNDRLLDIGPSRVVGSVEEIARLEAWKTEA